jgi:hypothetical protein
MQYATVHVPCPFVEENQNNHPLWRRKISFVIATEYWLDVWGLIQNVREYPDSNLDPLSLLSSLYQEQSGHGVKLTIDLHVVSRLGMA